MYASLAEELKWYGNRVLSELVGVFGAFRYTSCVLQGTAALSCFVLALKVPPLGIFHITVRGPVLTLSSNCFRCAESVYSVSEFYK